MRVPEFPKQLEKAIKDTEKSVMEKLEFTYKHGAELAAKEIEGERKLNKQLIAALEAKIKEQEEHISQLTQTQLYRTQNSQFHQVEKQFLHILLVKLDKGLD